MAVDERSLIQELAGLDALEQALGKQPSRARKVWRQVWPKLAAVALFLLGWQLVVWSGWKEEYILPGPGKVLPTLWDLMGEGRFWDAVARTLRRGLWGYFVAALIGTAIGVAVARIPVLRIAIGSMITGVQTMPSVAWFPLAIVLFQLSERAILFVIILGAAPSIANGVIAGVDHVPPILLRSGRMLGARGLKTYRHVVMPAALPTFITGLKQGWAFAWRSLLAGELIALIPGHPGLGSEMDFARTNAVYDELIAWMIVLFVIGVVVDLAFSKADLTLRKRWGLIDPAA